MRSMKMITPLRSKPLHEHFRQHGVNQYYERVIVKTGRYRNRHKVADGVQKYKLGFAVNVIRDGAYET